MKTETEVKFIQIDVEHMRQKLHALGAECKQPMRLMTRVIIDYPDDRMQLKDAFVRIRDEGDKTTVTYKQFISHSVDGAKEIEFAVDDFESAVKLFEQIGLSVRSFQESKRETWKLGDVEIVIDEWPWLRPYIEIEGDSEGALKQVADKLELDWNDAIFGDVMAAYRAQYTHLTDKHAISTIAEVRFDDPLPKLLKK